MALIDKASLLMVPSVYEDGTLYNVLPSGNKAPDETGNHNGYDQTRADFTFSRGSNLAATRIGPNGLIEKGRENLFTQSNNFSHSDWNVKAGTFTQGVADPDGGNNAWAWEATNTDPYLYQSGKSKSGVSVLSIWVKGVGSTIGKYFEFRIGGTPYYNFVLTGEWQRLEYYVNHSSGGSSVGWEYGNPAVVGDVVHIYQAQYEVGTIATAYMDSGATTATAGVLENTPRIDYSSGAGALLLEPQRTNSIANSEYTDGSNWSNEGSITDEENTSETTSPEGLYNAVKLVSANATSEQWIQTTGVQTTNATDCTISCFVKKSDYDYFHIRFTGINGAFAAGSVWFNIAEGSVGTKQTGISADIKDYGNGWYRISATKEATATTTAGIRFQLASSDNDYNVVGDGVKGTYIYGCQAEIGSHVSSYVPTYGSAATRGADSCSVTGASDVIGQSEGVIFMDFVWDNSTASSADYPIMVYGSNTSNFVGLNTNTNTNQMLVYSGGSAVAAIGGGSFVVGQRYKVAMAYKANDFAYYINGEQKGTDTAGAVPVGLASVRTETPFSSKKTAQKTKEIIFFNERLSNTELATLTTL